MKREMIDFFFIGGTHRPGSAAESERGHGRADRVTYKWLETSRWEWWKQVNCMWGHLTGSCSRKVLQSGVLIRKSIRHQLHLHLQNLTCISLHPELFSHLQDWRNLYVIYGVHQVLLHWSVYILSLKWFGVEVCKNGERQIYKISVSWWCRDGQIINSHVNALMFCLVPCFVCPRNLTDVTNIRS